MYGFRVRVCTGLGLGCGVRVKVCTGLGIGQFDGFLAGSLTGFRPVKLTVFWPVKTDFSLDGFLARFMASQSFSGLGCREA